MVALAFLFFTLNHLGKRALFGKHRRIGLCNSDLTILLILVILYRSLKEANMIYKSNLLLHALDFVGQDAVITTFRTLSWGCTFFGPVESEAAASPAQIR
jgi:hypothetical protein